MVTINTIILSIAGLFMLYIGYKSLTLQTVGPPQIPSFLWNQSTGKEKLIQSKTGDASLAIELIRRRVIQGFGRDNKSKLKESRTQKGSTTGALETFFITGICSCSCPPPNIIFDGGAAIDEFCPIHGDQDVYDAGGADTTVCGV